MVKPKQVIVKQPALGQKILELRKAKGLTQEDLVEKCNINVRTIQRIEAGEVTPRIYTVKTILEALGYDLNTIQFHTPGENPNAEKQNNGFLRISFFVGVLYFMLSFIESFLDFKIWGVGFPNPEFNNIISFGGYLAIKVSVIITFAVFMLGYFRMTEYYPNGLVKTTSVILAALTFVFLSIDVYSFYEQEANAFFLPVVAISYGIVCTVFGLGLMKYRNVLGDLAFYSGLTGIAAGIALMTLILALPGLVMLAVSEVLQLALLYRAFERHKTESLLTTTTG